MGKANETKNDLALPARKARCPSYSRCRKDYPRNPRV